MGNGRVLRALPLLYFLSGMTALVDEVVFSKYLSFVFGATAYASSAVLVAFMAGMAIGSWAVSKRILHIERPLRVYALLELAVAFSCVAIPFVFDALGGIYTEIAEHGLPLSALHFVRGGLAMLVVGVPTVAMGATLPVLARVVLESGGTTRLYAMNTFGGASGALLSAYAIVPTFGLRATLFGSAAIGTGIALLSFWGGPRAPLPSPQGRQEPPSWGGQWRLLVGSFSSGVLVFVAEVLFVHILALVVGTSVYAFGLVVAIFLVCLSLGAWISERPVFRGLLGAPLAFAIPALALVATLPVWDKLPPLFELAGPRLASWHGREALRIFVSVVALCVPTTAMGLAFPTLLARCTGPHGPTWVGRASMMNTLGAIAGSLLGGFVLLPQLGTERSVLLLSASYALSALGMLLPAEWSTGRGRALVLACLAVPGVAWGLPRWDLVRLSSGSNVYFDDEFRGGEILYLHEDVHGGVTTVKNRGGVRTLYTNGKFQGDTGFQMAAQYGLAHIPAMWAPRWERALVIGLGTGATTGALLGYPFQVVDVAELSPGIVRAAERHFSEINFRALSDPRVRVLYEDGRNVLLVGQSRYDVISIELSSIWFAGAANLYNVEFYTLAKRRLSDGGILQQWMQLHHTTETVIAVQLASLRAAFPHVWMYVHGDQGIVLASLSPFAPNERVVSAAQQPHAFRPGESYETLRSERVLSERGVDHFIRTHGGGQLSTDDNLYLEYETPKHNLPTRRSIEQMTEVLRDAEKNAP